jgi:hypothetical protein
MSYFNLLVKIHKNLSSPARSWYHESLHNKDTLLITAGDSWTWGDSLFDIDAEAGKQDHPDRVNKIYGALLAKKLDADFINLAKCAGANIEFCDWVKSLLPMVETKYKKIIVAITLTENCREAHWDRVWVPEEQPSLEEYLCEYEKNMFENLAQTFKQHSSIQFVVSRNFTYSFDSNISVLKDYLTEKIWVDCLAEYQSNQDYPTDVRFLSSIALVPMHKLLKDIDLYKKYKFQFMSLYASSELAISWLEKSKLNYQKATKHPTELGHEIWADYLYNTITARLH